MLIKALSRAGSGFAIFEQTLAMNRHTSGRGLIQNPLGIKIILSSSTKVFGDGYKQGRLRRHIQRHVFAQIKKGLQPRRPALKPQKNQLKTITYKTPRKTQNTSQLLHVLNG